MSIVIARQELRSSTAKTAKARKRLEDLLEGVRSEVAHHQAQIVRLREKTPHVLLEEDEKGCRRHEEAIAKACRERDLGEAMAAELEDRISASLAHDPERQERLDALLREVEPVRKWLTQRYPKMAADLAQGVERLLEIERRIDALNDDLPAGAPRIEGVEAAAGRPRAARTIAEGLVLPSLDSELNLWPPNSVSSFV